MTEYHLHNTNSNDDRPPIRFHLMMGIMVFFFMVLGVRLWYLQVVKGVDYRVQSESNRNETVEVDPVRGLIMDRHGKILMNNRVLFDLAVRKTAVTDDDKFLSTLSQVMKYPVELLRVEYEALDDSNKAVQPFLTNITREQLVAVETNRHHLEALSIRPYIQRLPVNDVLASHLLGYMNEISQVKLDSEQEQLEEGVRQLVREGETREKAHQQLMDKINPHKGGDLIGQGGIEQSMERYLQGRRGYVVNEINSRGRLVEELNRNNPRPGYHVRLTIDSRLQALGQALLGERAGAIVVMNPQNFEVLVLASSPTYNLSDFVGGIRTERWESLQNDPFKPMFNRAVSGQYPPGSTYKIVVALAALAEGVITPETEFNCVGSLQLGNSTFGCHKRAGHGKVNLRESLKVSCDVYYYEIGRALGVDRLAKLSREFFGLGRTLGVDLLTEQAGLIPDVAWKQRKYSEKWMLGETMPVSIGQGYVLNTPLQVAQFTSVLANGGSLYRPHLVKDLLDINNEVVKSFEPVLIHKLDIDPAHIEAVQDGLEAVVAEVGGTGRRAALPDIKVAGKSGTSQVVSNIIFQGFDNDNRPYKYRDHAWFTGYAPADHPEVVVTVLLEHTGGGGAFAAPVAQKMLAAYFDTSIKATTLPPPQVQPDNPTGLESYGL